MSRYVHLIFVLFCAHSFWATPTASQSCGANTVSPLWKTTCIKSGSAWSDALTLMCAYLAPGTLCSPVNPGENAFIVDPLWPTCSTDCQNARLKKPVAIDIDDDTEAVFTLWPISYPQPGVMERAGPNQTCTAWSDCYATFCDSLASSDGGVSIVVLLDSGATACQ